jgi:hypothetical protein
MTWQVMGLGSAAMLVVISPKLSLVTLSVVPAMALGATKYSKVGDTVSFWGSAVTGRIRFTLMMLVSEIH